MAFSNRYIVGFALVLCLVCSLVVSSLAVGLEEAQETNKRLDRQINVLRVAGIIGPEDSPDLEEVSELFADITPILVDRETGEVVGTEEEARGYDPIKAAKDPDRSAPTDSELASAASVKRVPDRLLLYRVDTQGHEGVVFPIQGYGLWSTLYGYLALQPDHQTIQGITYYQHGETPGLGGEVDNLRWKAMWQGKKAYRGDDVAIEVVKKNSVPKLNEYQIDGLSGATITSNGVTNMLRFWLSDEAYGRYLRQSAES